MANKMKIEMDDLHDTSVAVTGDVLVMTNDEGETEVFVTLDRVEEFIGHIRTVVEFHNKQTRSKDADLISEEG